MGGGVCTRFLFFQKLYAVMTSRRAFLKSHFVRTAQTPVFADFIL